MIGHLWWLVVFAGFGFSRFGRPVCFPVFCWGVGVGRVAFMESLILAQDERWRRA